MPYSSPWLEVAVKVRTPVLAAAPAAVIIECSDSSVTRVVKELKGFGRVELDPGRAIDLEIEIKDEDLCFYDADARGWKLEECGYSLRVGQSSADLPLSSTWKFGDGAWAAT